MARYLLERSVQAIAVIVTVLVLVFLLLRISPADPAQIAGGVEASPAAVKAIAREFGTDRSIPQQFADFVSGLVHGSLGTSIHYSEPVTSVIGQAAPYTALLAVTSLLLSVSIAVLLGTRAASRPGSSADTISSVLAAAGQAMPAFWTGLLLIQLFAVQLKLLPTDGFVGPQSLILPSMTVALAILPTQLRVLRASLRAELAEDYVRTANAFGLRPRRIRYVYALRNASLPVLAVIGVDIGYLLGGVIVVEAVFNYPGIGQVLISGFGSRDYPLIQALAIGSAVVFVAINFLLDILYSLVDPRVRLHG